MCDLENLVDEEAIAGDWAAAPCKKKLLTKYCSGDKIEKNEMGEACSA
jgi:hypothetical protein